MIIKESPCYKCESRSICCHSSCKKYKEWKEERKQVIEYIKPKNCYATKCRWRKSGNKFIKEIHIV